jgi:hypothetical protein
VTYFRHRSLSTHQVYREDFTLLTGSKALRFTATGAPPAAKRIEILLMNQHVWRPITFGMKGSSYLCSHITEGAENAVPHTGERGSDLPFEAVLQEYL